MEIGERRRVPTSLNIPSRASPVSSSDSDCSSTSSAKSVPPISNIPGLNHDYATGNYREPVRSKARPARDVDSEYLRLVRQGGRKDLLHYKEFVPGQIASHKGRPEDSIFYQSGKKEVPREVKVPAKYVRQRRDSTSSSDSSPGVELVKSKTSFKVPRRISPQDHNILEYQEYKPTSDFIQVPRGPFYEALDHGYDTPWERDDSDKDEPPTSGSAPLKSAEMRRPLPIMSLPCKQKPDIMRRKSALPKVQAGSRLINGAKPIRVG